MTYPLIYLVLYQVTSSGDIFLMKAMCQVMCLVMCLVNFSGDVKSAVIVNGVKNDASSGPSFT